MAKGTKINPAVAITAKLPKPPTNAVGTQVNKNLKTTPLYGANTTTPMTPSQKKAAEDIKKNQKVVQGGQVLQKAGVFPTTQVPQKAVQKNVVGNAVTQEQQKPAPVKLQANGQPVVTPEKKTYIRDASGKMVEKTAGAQMYNAEGEAIVYKDGHYVKGTGLTTGTTPEGTKTETKTAAQINAERQAAEQAPKGTNIQPGEKPLKDMAGQEVIQPDITQPDITGLEDLTGYQDQFAQLNKSLTDLGSSFNQARQSLISQTSGLDKSIAQIEQESGGIINTSDLNLQKELAAGGDPNAILRKYILSPQDRILQKPDILGYYAGAVSPNKPDPVNADKYVNNLLSNKLSGRNIQGAYKPTYLGQEGANQAGNQQYGIDYTGNENTNLYADESLYDQNKPETSISNILAGLGKNLTAEGAMSLIANYGQDMTASQIIQAELVSKLGLIDNDKTQQFLDSTAQRAVDGYNSYMDLYNKGVVEVDKATSGELTAPQTYEGLQAKILTENKEYQEESISIEKGYMEQKFAAEMGVERDNRSRLEGYCKAKLYANGSTDSSAGITSMGIIVNQADLRLNLMQADQNRALAQLNIQSRQVMTDYTNNITKIVLDKQSEQGQAASALEDKLFDIDKMKIENEGEKNKLKSAAITAATDKMLTLKAEQKKQEWEEYQFSYKLMRDKMDDALKLSDQMGTAHYVDTKGNIVDSGVPTFEASKWQETSLLANKQYDLSVDKNQQAMAKDIWDKLGQKAAPIIEKMYGLKEGELNFQTVDEQKMYFDQKMKSIAATQKTQKAAEKTSQLNTITGWLNDGATITNSSSNIADYYNKLGAATSSSMAGMKGGQCGAFVHQIVSDWPYNKNTLNQKIAAANMDPADVANNIQPGDLVITDEGGEAGHIFAISSVNNGLMHIVESNLKLNERVTTYRTMSVNDPRIKAGFHGTLKPQFQAMFEEPTIIPPDSLKTNLNNLDAVSSLIPFMSDTLKGYLETIPSFVMEGYTVEDLIDTEQLTNLYDSTSSDMGSLSVLSDKALTDLENYHTGDKSFYNSLTATQKRYFMEKYYTWNSIFGDAISGSGNEKKKLSDLTTASGGDTILGKYGN